MAMTQESILLSLIQNDKGTEFTSEKSGWEQGTDACSWFGVQCDDMGEVTQISLTGYELQATLPTELAQLSSLEHFTLSNCMLQGTIPSSIAHMANLRTFDVTFNELTGSIPFFLSSKLALLALGHNQLTGQIHMIGSVDLPELVTFVCKDNYLTGSIPSFSASFPKLMELDFSENLLVGSIPAIDGLPSLKRLYVSDNALSGTLPSNVTGSIQELRLEKNLLTGTIPPSYSAAMPDLEVLLIHNNRLIGTIPQNLCTLDLNFGYITNVVVGNNDNSNRYRRTSELLQDECSAIACPQHYRSDTGQAPCFPCENNSINPYLGATACLNLTQDDILDIVAEVNFGVTSKYPLWGINPTCSREGVTCDENGNVQRLRLIDLGLTGTLPLELGFLPHLVELDVSNNQLSGHIPEELSLPPLETLTLAENLLSGYVPDSLCNKQGINGNGQDNLFSCDIIACSMGTHNPQGHAGPGLSGDPCESCPLVDGLVLANTNCGTRNGSSTLTDSGMAEWLIILVVVGVALLLISVGFWVLRRIGSAPQVAFKTVQAKKHTNWDAEINTGSSTGHEDDDSEENGLA